MNADYHLYTLPQIELTAAQSRILCTRLVSAAWSRTLKSIDPLAFSSNWDKYGKIIVSCDLLVYQAILFWYNNGGLYVTQRSEREWWSTYRRRSSSSHRTASAKSSQQCETENTTRSVGKKLNCLLFIVCLRAWENKISRTIAPSDIWLY